MGYVITHHALHEDAGVYRLAFADQQMVKHNDELIPVLGEERDVIWSASDERWEGMTDSQIADAQVREVKAALRDQEEAAEKRRSAVRPVQHFETLGQGL